MTYVLYGQNDFLIKSELDKMITKNEVDSDCITNYNADSLIEDIINDAYTLPLFSNKKLLIVDGDIFSSDNSKIIEKYLNKENPSTLLVFIVRNDKLDERKKIFKLIKNKIECNKININSFIKNQLEDYQISNSTINKLIDRVGNNLNNLSNEIEKLKTYKINDKIINEEDLEITIKNIDDDIFSFIDNVINRNSEKTIETYHEILRKNGEPIGIIVMIANQIRLMYQVKIMYARGINQDSIASTLGVHPYRVKLALEKGRFYSEDTLLILLESLADLDISIKSGKIDADIGLELFLLGM